MNWKLTDEDIEKVLIEEHERWRAEIKDFGVRVVEKRIVAQAQAKKLVGWLLDHIDSEVKEYDITDDDTGIEATAYFRKDEWQELRRQAGL